MGFTNQLVNHSRIHTLDGYTSIPAVGLPKQHQHLIITSLYKKTRFPSVSPGDEDFGRLSSGDSNFSDPIIKKSNAKLYDQVIYVWRLWKHVKSLEDHPT